MEQFVLVPASVYSKSLNTQAVTKQELRKYHAEENPTYQTYYFIKEKNNKQFAEADSLVNIFCLVLLSSSDGRRLWYIGWRKNWSFIVTLCSKMLTTQTFTLINLTLLGNRRLWFWIKMRKPKREEAGFFSRKDSQQLQRLHTRGIAHASVRNLVKASILPVSKAGQFSHWETFKKNSRATRKFVKMEALARIKSRTCFMDLATLIN